MDKDKIKQGVQLIIEGIGEDASREGLVETPDRIARMYEEIFAGLNENASVHLSKTFSTQNTDMIIEKDITFYSMCEHHFLPFYGKAHIAYMNRDIFEPFAVSCLTNGQTRCKLYKYENYPAKEAHAWQAESIFWARRSGIFSARPRSAKRARSSSPRTRGRSSA